MKAQFHGYYRPSKAEFDELWKTSLFSFDASFLLNLYHYSGQTGTAFLNILKSLDNRIWLTHQAALEYQRGRPKAICQELGPYDKMKAELIDISTTLQSSSKHPFVKPETVADFNRLSESLIKELDLGRRATEEFLTTSDPILLTLTQLFDGRTGQPFPPAQRAQIEKDGKERYIKLIPPGFADLKEKERDPALDPYGDYIIWLQLLEKAKASKQGIILVTDDLKEDWWHKHDKRMIGPHPLLRHEMQDVAGCPFYMYTGESFLAHAGEYLNQPVEAQVKREVKEAADERRNYEYRMIAGVQTLVPRNFGIPAGRVILPKGLPLPLPNPPFQDPDIMPPVGTEVPVTLMRWAEFSMVGKLIGDLCEDVVMSPDDNDHLLPSLTLIRGRLTLLKGRWFEELSPVLQGELTTLIHLASHLEGLPSDQRYQLVITLNANSERLVQAIADLHKAN